MNWNLLAITVGRCFQALIVSFGITYTILVDEWGWCMAAILYGTYEMTEALYAKRLAAAHKRLDEAYDMVDAIRLRADEAIKMTENAQEYIVALSEHISKLYEKLGVPAHTRPIPKQIDKSKLN